MNFESHNGISIQTAFEEYHRNNPEVYEWFKTLAFHALRSGKKKVSFKLIMNVIRWEKFLLTTDVAGFTESGEKKKFKINDAYGSRYARMFIKDYPAHADKIEMRALRS